MLIRLLLLGLTGLFLTGCNPAKTIGVDLNFTKTNFGFVNSGAYRAGSMFLWDREANTLSYLGDVPGFEQPAIEEAPDRALTYSAGLKLDANLTALQKLAVEGEIKRRSRLIVDDAHRVPYSNVYTKITSYLEADIDNDGSLLDEWSFKEVVESHNLKYVIIRDVTYGSRLKVSIDQEVQQGASFPVKVGNATYNIKVSGRAAETISGANSAITFNVYVLNAYYKDGTNPAVELQRGLDLSDLPDLFRQVGNTS